MVLALLKDGLKGFDKYTCVYTTETSFKRQCLSIVVHSIFCFFSISLFWDGDQLNKLILGPANGLQPMVLKTLH